MGRIRFTAPLARQYIELYKSCQIRPGHWDTVDRLADRLYSHKGRYEAVASELGVPWYVVGAIHNMESSQNFSAHLHNGDLLTAKTVHVPKGRPIKGSAPFTWAESAADALRMHRLHLVTDWSLPRVLYEIERYNGWGYRRHHPHVLSPYLWSFTNHYRSGKYVADGRWSESAKSRQCGAAALLRRLEEKGRIAFKEWQPVKPVEPAGQIPAPAEAAAEPAPAAEETGPLFYYSRSVVPRAAELQHFLNRFPGIALREDGKPAKRTSAAVKKVFGFYLQGDPRAEAMSA